MRELQPPPIRCCVWVISLRELAPSEPAAVPDAHPMEHVDGVDRHDPRRCLGGCRTPDQRVGNGFSAGRQPAAVKHRAATLDNAVDGAVEKMKKSIESTLGREDRR